MNILYISTVCSNKKYSELFKLCNGKVFPSIQNFHSSILSGLKQNGCNITALSGLTVSQKTTKKIFFKYDHEIENGITYRYPFFINLIGFKQFFIAFQMLVFIIFWFFKNTKKEKFVIIDSSYVSVSFISLFISKILNLKVAAIVADIYDYMSDKINKNKSLLKRILSFFSRFCWTHYDFFILLTEAMNLVINQKNKPYFVMEGIVENDKFSNIPSIKKQSSDEVIFMYAGGLHKKYGLKRFIDAFIEIDNPKLQLWLFGSGDLDSYIEKLSKKNIIYWGKMPNEKILEMEKKADILINPRFSKSEYTKYSFPSKIIEYMASGTPVLTTKLPGVPKEYDNYIYCFDRETKKGFIDKINEMINISREKLIAKGKTAQEFIFKNKNSTVQTKKILNNIKEISNKSENYIVPKISNKIFQTYLLVLFVMFLFLSRNTLYSSLYLGVENSYYILLVMSLPLLYKYFKNTFASDIKTRLFKTFCTFIAFIVVVTLLKGDFQSYIFSTIVSLCIGYIYSRMIIFEKFKRFFVLVICLLSISSIVNLVFIKTLSVNSTILEFLRTTGLYKINSSGTPFFCLFTSFVADFKNYFRNFSIFTEPAFFQFYIFFAFLIEIFSQNKNKIKKIIILLLAVFSTFSAAGIIMLILTFIYFIIYGIVYKKKEYFLWIFIIILALGTIMFFNHNIYILFINSAKKIYTFNQSSVARYGSILNNIVEFVKSPIIGNKFDFIIMGRTITNTFFSSAAIFGFAFPIFLMTIMYNTVSNISKNKWNKLFAFIILFLSINNHIFFGVQSFWIIFLPFAFANKNTMTKPNTSENVNGKN